MSKLLEGIRVLDLTRMLAGPYATLILSDFGAEVIKIEEVESGDEIRGMGPPFINGWSPYFIAINRGKKSVTLNIKSDEGRKIFYKLVQKSDVVINNFRPGIVERLKIDPVTLRNQNPSVITCSITSFGEEGTLAGQPAFDLAIQAYSGAMSVTGEPGRPPVRMGIPLGDLAGGMFAATAVCAALHRRNASGKGEHISISLLDALVAMHTYVAQYYFTDGKVPDRQGSGHMSVVPYGAYKTKDIYIVVAVFTEKFWRGFCEAIDHCDLIHDARFSSNLLRVKNRAALEPILQEVFLTRTGQEWLGRLGKKGIPSAPVNTLDHALELDSLLTREMVTQMHQPDAGEIKILGNPVKVSGDHNTFPPAPRLGEHTVETLAKILGLDASEIQFIRDRKIA